MTIPSPCHRRLISGTVVGLGLLYTKTLLAQPVPSRAGDALDQIMTQRLLRVVEPKEFPPCAFIKNGNTEGYDITIAHMPAIGMKVKLELVPVQSADRLLQ
ncbi:hypothetical protein [Hydrogenophaga sp. SL48]|uniref:hypothetical protein n=1 Tax=Hydrogenophaga sp. SL48 TaxID=2806347 RepID=UPI001F46D49F|nr:hypothetical protein [Hydrogenophaga sp. SL48]UJW83119.1 hypothetical protein IM738_10855 [Hydrogenophaga sp. SL48]